MDIEAADMSLLERVNPVFLTARMSLSALAMSGDPDAAAISELLDHRFGPAGASHVPAEQVALSYLQNLANSVFLEIRYRTVSEMAERTDCAAIVDLPCGFTPRGLQMSEKHRSYIGLDLPAAISEMERVIPSLGRTANRSFLRYAPVDATNYESLASALEGARGPVCITTEGLLMYFTNHETDALCDNIRRLLVRYGGCWITCDPEMMVQNTIVMRAIAADRYQEIMNRIMNGFERKADTHVESPAMMILPWKNGGKDIEADKEKALRYLSEKGLQAERLPVGQFMPDIRSFSRIPSEAVHAIKTGMEQCAYWKITVKPDEGQKKAEEVAAEAFSAKAVLNEGILELTLSGRVDTLTAPYILNLYEKISQGTEVHGIDVDCSKLQYISSAGLRVLMIMRKKHRVTMHALNRTVRETLVTTGFDSFIASNAMPGPDSTQQ